VADVERLSATGLASRLGRALVEIIHPTISPATNARAIDDALDPLEVTVPRLHHGEQDTTWLVLRQAEQLGRDWRTGLEGTLTFPDGSNAPSNEAVVRVALSL
jgi:uncharacterized protein (DUF849 family)